MLSTATYEIKRQQSLKGISQNFGARITERSPLPEVKVFVCLAVSRCRRTHGSVRTHAVPSAAEGHSCRKVPSLRRPEEL